MKSPRVVVYVSAGNVFPNDFCTCWVLKPEHTTGGSSRRCARRGGGTRRGRAEQDADGSGGPEANEHVALVHAAGKQEPADEDSLRSARIELLVRLVGKRLPEVHILAEGEVLLVGRWLTSSVLAADQWSVAFLSL